MKISKIMKMKRKQPVKSDHSITLKNRDYHFTLIRKEIKHTYIKIKPTGLFVTTNFHTNLRQIYRLLEKYQTNIIEKLEKFESNCSDFRLEDDEVYYLGERYKIVTRVDLLQDTYIDHEQNMIVFNKHITKRDLETFFRNQAEKIFNDRLSVMYNYFMQYRVKNPMLKIRKMRSRYGTCYYNDQKIILNLNLIHCRIIHIDYVIAHELCHFLHHDHGKEFKALLSQIIPDWRERKKELNKQFARLTT